MNLKMMPFRKYSARSLIFITAILVLAGCASVTERLATTPAKEKVVEHNLISGREGSNGPVLAVKIDDTAQAHPQIGIDQADVVRNIGFFASTHPHLWCKSRQELHF